MAASPRETTSQVQRQVKISPVEHREWTQRLLKLNKNKEANTERSKP